jgi:hypothetical protein
LDTEPQQQPGELNDERKHLENSKHANRWTIGTFKDAKPRLVYQRDNLCSGRDTPQGCR